MQRNCGTCTKCCEGWLSADIYGHEMTRGNPCHFFKSECTIYPIRPVVCKEFRCAWLRNEKEFLPDWMRPDISKQIIMFHRLPEYEYFEIINAGEDLNLTMITWIVGEANRKGINIKYRVDNQVFFVGSDMFKKLAG